MGERMNDMSGAEYLGVYVFCAAAYRLLEGH